MRERHVAELLAEVFRRSGMKRAVRRAEAVLLWPQVVGADVARFAEAKIVRDGVLYVDVSDSETATHLSLQRQRFLDVYRARFESFEIKDIRFRVGRVSRPAEDEAPAPQSRPDPDALAALARSLGAMDLPEGVASAAMRAGRALLGYRARREAEGWTPCPTCGVLCQEEGLCAACARYAQNGRVRDAARLLAVRPGVPSPALSDQERDVAAHLAAASLDRTLDELLPQALADPGLKPQLENAARCRAALAARKTLDDVDEADMERLPARLRRVLGVL
ncbi:MAG TPA: DUF721 domain-containing protein [Trueperaceae bacterium]|nr:DUF721 domain-containing protein [Trueperaceae bacterium]